MLYFYFLKLWNSYFVLYTIFYNCYIYYVWRKEKKKKKKKKKKKIVKKIIKYKNNNYI